MAAKSVTVVDIRDQGSFKNARISGAISVSDQNIDEFKKTTDKAKPLICYCYHGHSSQMAAAYFVEEGFQEVYSLDGGFENWKLNFPVDQTNSA